MLEGAIFDQQFLMLFLTLLSCQHFEKLFRVLEILFAVLDSAIKLIMVQSHIALSETIQQTRERIRKAVGFRPYFFEVVL